jgi:hypothetical protein
MCLPFTRRGQTLRNQPSRNACARTQHLSRWVQRMTRTLPIGSACVRTCMQGDHLTPRPPTAGKFERTTGHGRPAHLGKAMDPLRRWDSGDHVGNAFVTATGYFSRVWSGTCGR